MTRKRRSEPRVHMFNGVMRMMSVHTCACMVSEMHSPPDVVSELEGREHDDNRTAVSLETGSQVLIFESGASRANSFFACFVPV